jgi:hypothetical protein
VHKEHDLTDKQLEGFYVSYFFDFSGVTNILDEMKHKSPSPESIAKFADHHSFTIEQAEVIIEKGREAHRPSVQNLVDAFTFCGYKCPAI